MPRIRKPLGVVVDENARTAAQIGAPGSKSEARTEGNAAETLAAPSKKRKSTEAAPIAPTASTTKKAKAAKEAVKKAIKEVVKDAASDLLDVSDVLELDDGEIPVYDTCGTIRRKIRALLAKDGITQAAFLRAIVAAAHRERSTKKIQLASPNAFMKQKGSLAGNTSSVYYAAYVFFEKLRIKKKKPKSKDREIMEEIHFDGVDTRVQSGKISYLGSANSKISMDRYGRVGCF